MALISDYCRLHPGNILFTNKCYAIEKRTSDQTICQLLSLSRLFYRTHAAETYFLLIFLYALKLRFRLLAAGTSIGHAKKLCLSYRPQLVKIIEVFPVSFRGRFRCVYNFVSPTNRPTHRPEDTLQQIRD